MKPEPIPALPAGYNIRGYREGDEEALAGLMVLSGFKKWTGEKFRAKAFCGLLGTDGVIVIEYAGRPAATCTALVLDQMTNGKIERVYNPSWLASDPAHRGIKLGLAAAIASWNKACERGLLPTIVKTDDWRLPAIRQYLGLYYVSVEPDALHRARWRLIRRLLSHPELAPRTVQFKGRDELWNKALFWELFFPFKLAALERRRERLVEEILARASGGASPGRGD